MVDPRRKPGKKKKPGRYKPFHLSPSKSMAEVLDSTAGRNIQTPHFQKNTFKIRTQGLKTIQAPGRVGPLKVMELKRIKARKKARGKKAIERTVKDLIVMLNLTKAQEEGISRLLASGKEGKKFNLEKKVIELKREDQMTVKRVLNQFAKKTDAATKIQVNEVFAKVNKK